MIKINFLDNIKRYPPNDIGISRLFIDSFSDELLFCNDSSCWYVWNNKYWEKDTKDGGLRNEKIKRLAEYCNSTIITHPKVDDDNREKLLKVYAKLYTKNYRDIILKDAMSVSPVKDNKFDNNCYLFNCKNGTYDFEKQIFRDFDRNDYITNISNVKYDKNADCKRFKEYLYEVMENNTEKIDYLMKMAAYGYTGNVTYDCFFVLYGNKTRNGKSTFVGINSYILGSYASNLKPDIVTRKQQGSNGNNASPDLMAIKNSRFVTIAEIENGMMLDISLIKTMTGKNLLSARNLYENSVQFYPKFKLYFDTNFLPKMTDDTIFQSDRLHLIEFNRHFEQNERDLFLMDKLKNESSGIFNMIIYYYSKLKKEGFIIPDSSKQVIKRYQLNSNNILAFKTSRLYENSNSYIKSSKLYEEYKAWCEDEELKYLSKKNFKEEMLKHNAIYTDKERHTNEQGISEPTFWVKGFSLTQSNYNVNQNSQIEIIPINYDEELPF